MQISAELLQAMYVTFNTAFLNGLQRGRRVPVSDKTMLQYLVKFPEIAMNIPSTTGSEAHIWISQIPGFVEWVGDRVAQTLSVNGLKVDNRDFQQTIEILRNAVLDNMFGAYSTVSENMGAEGSDDAFWLDLVIAALISTNTWADGLAFFSAARKFGDYTVDNVVDGSLTQANLQAAINKMLGFTGDKGKPLNVVPYMVLCGKTAFWKAKKFTTNETITDDAGNQVTNETLGCAAPRWHYGLPDNAWYLLGVKGGFNPLCAQRRQEATALQTLVNPNDPNVFWQKKFVYGTDLRGEGFRPFPFLIVRGSDGAPAGAPAGIAGSDAKKGKKDDK
jgi:phage major head subunit gpT-like protein